MAIRSRGTQFGDIVKRVSNYPIMEAGRLARKELIAESVSRGWRRFKQAIKVRKISKESCGIYVDNTKKDTDGPTNSEIAQFLHGGTDRHEVKPVNKKALFWKGKVVVSKGVSAKMKTQGFFSKGHMVSGIKASKWFELNESIREKVNKFTSDFIKTR